MHDDLLPDWMQANNAALDALHWLAKLADAGDGDAARELAAAGCAAARWLEPHGAIAAGVREWPIAVPAGRKERERVLKVAAGMRIGATRGGGKGSGVRGAPDKDDGQKAFALEVLGTVNLARMAIRCCGGWAATKKKGEVMLCRLGRKPIGCFRWTVTKRKDWRMEWPVVARRRNFRVDILRSAGLEALSDEIAERVANLPDYGPETREQWIDVCVGVAWDNPHLVPVEFKDRGKTSVDVIERGKTRTVEYRRGGVLQAALRKGLATVDTLPP